MLVTLRAEHWHKISGPLLHDRVTYSLRFIFIFSHSYQDRLMATYFIFWITVKY